MNMKNVIALDFTGFRLEVALTSRCELYLAGNVENKEHRVVCISALETEIGWFEYLSLKM